MTDLPRRVVTDSMIGLTMSDVGVLSDRVTVILGQNPGPATGPGTNTYLVGTSQQPILLDTGQGMPQYVSFLERGLGETRGGDRLQEIVLTHGHMDHQGGVGSVRERFGPLKVSKKPWDRLDGALRVTGIDEGSEVATEGATLRAIWTPGHSWDHLCFYMPEERALFSGDVVLGAGTTVIPQEGDLGDYLRSLRHLLTLELDLIYPAHGPVIRNPREKIESYLAHRQLRDEQILEGLGAGVRKIPALVKRIYTDVPEILHDAAGMSVLAHLRKLESEGRVAREGEDWSLR